MCFVHLLSVSPDRAKITNLSCGLLSSRSLAYRSFANVTENSCPSAVASIGTHRQKVIPSARAYFIVHTPSLMIGLARGPNRRAQSPVAESHAASVNVIAYL